MRVAPGPYSGVRDAKTVRAVSETGATTSHLDPFAAHKWQRTQPRAGGVRTWARSKSTSMSQRTFADPTGVTWSVMVIVPQLTERRMIDRRSHPKRDVDFRAERRSVPDRRHVREVRAPVREGFERGWLVFDNGEEKRRLAPVPEGWERMTPLELDALCSRAKPTHQRWTRLVE